MGFATMKARSFESAETVIFDPVTANRNTTAASLHRLGFRNVELAASLESLNSILSAKSPDLFLCEAVGSEAQICKLVQSIRHGTFAKNPFKVIVVTTWRSDDLLVPQLLNAGADDLLVRPISTAVLSERIKLHIEKRKNFVVTGDYIGPDRRSDSARGGAPTFPVPNSLEIRTDPEVTPEEAAQLIASTVKTGRESLNGEKMRRTAFQLSVHWRLLEKELPSNGDVTEILERMQVLNNEIGRRAGTAGESEIVGICKSVDQALGALKALAARLKSGTGEANADFAPALRLLQQAAMGLNRRFSPDESDSAHLSDLDAVVAKIGPRPKLASVA